MSSGYTLRRAEKTDTKEINELVSNAGGLSIYKATFGTVNFKSIIESSYASIVAINNDSSLEHCSGFISVNDVLPSIVADVDFYDTIFELLTNFIPASSSNTNFINSWLLDEDVQNFDLLGTEMIKKIFSICFNVDYLVWICPKNFIPSQYVEKNFSSIKLDSKAEELKDIIKKLNGMKLLFIHRSKFLTKLSVREARVEDNDDLIPILQNSNPDTLSGQESFFLADLIEAQDDKNKFYVGLNQNSIVGMLATSQDVNVSLITRIFNIDSYSDIVIQKTESGLPPPLLIAIVGDIRLLHLDTVKYTINGLNCLFINAETSNFDESSDSKSANEANVLQSYLQQLSTEYDLSSRTGIVFLAIPQGENEDQLQEICFKFDYIIEIINSNENAEEDDDDVFLQHHLDAVESLKEFYSQQEEGKKSYNKTDSGNSSVKAVWRKVMIDGEIVSNVDAVQLLKNDMVTILDDRVAQIELQKIRNREEPAKANAFAITVLCLNEDYWSRGQDLIKVAFEDHPQVEYCLYMVANIPAPPVELIGNLKYVPTRANISFDQSLYIMHRSAFLVNDHMKLLRLNDSLFPSLQHFSVSLKQTEQAMLLSAARSSLGEIDVHVKDNPLETCFLVNIGRVVIGSVVLSRRILTNEDLLWIKANYHIDELVDFDLHRIRNQMFITQWYLDPLYSFCTRRILQDIMRISNKTLLYFQAETIFAPPIELVDELVLLKPRRRVQAVGELTAEYIDRPSADNGGMSSECPLFFMSKHLLSKSKTINPKRVVIIGGSSHCYALLETLISVPYLILPNIYLVIDSIPYPLIKNDQSSEDGESKYDDEYSGCFSVHDEQYPTEKYLNSLGLGHKIKVIRGHLTDIDREHRAIVISNEMALEYDVLILSSATQDNSIKEIPSLSRTHPTRCADSGIFALGNPTIDNIALKYIKKRYPARTDDVIVYGSGLAALVAVSKLLRIGLSPNRITLVVQEEEGVIDLSLDKNIMSGILNGLATTGVKICWGCKISEVHLAHTGFLSSVEVKKVNNISSMDESKGESKTSIDRTAEESSEQDGVGESGIMLACLALLCCNSQKCDRDVFCAINDCGLVFDGGLVVDSTFSTIDKSIYAVSNYTRFSRVYKEALPHNCFNSREMGSFVALKILEQHLDPFPTASTASYATTSRADIAAPFIKNHSKYPPIPTFVLPKAISCELPGKLFFFSCVIPQKTSEVLGYFTNNPPTATNTLASNRNCLLKTDYLGNVVEFTYLGEDRVENSNLSLIPGMHESYLNSLVHSYTQGSVLDWISFFRQSWANALYQDHFPLLVKALRKNLETDKGMIMILNRVFEKSETIQDDQEIAVFRREFLGSNGEFVPENTYKTIEADTLEFLKDNRTLLPSYYLASGNNVQTSNNRF